MKLNFYEEDDKKNYCNQVYFEAKRLCELGSFSTEFKGAGKSDPQHRGYWRLCSLLVPYFQEQYKIIFDKDSVANIVKTSVNFTFIVGKTEIVRSIKTATKADMTILIEKLCEMCEYYKIKNYELTSAELRLMNEYYKS